MKTKNEKMNKNSNKAGNKSNSGKNLVKITAGVLIIFSLITCGVNASGE